MSDEHESPIKTPKQLIAVILAAFLVPITVIAVLVSMVTSQPKVGQGTPAMSEAETVARIAPVGHVDVVADNAPAAGQTGEEVFKGVCSTCHGAGIAGAPKFGDAKAWASRIAQGENTLFDHALKGYTGKSGVMPAKGGRPDLADIDVERAVTYMANGSGGKLAEPAAPAAGTATAPAPSAPTGPVAAVADPKVVAAVASANNSAAANAAAGANMDPGQKLYQGLCIACHGAGVNGAPKFGNKSDWGPRIAKGLPTLYDHALHGFNAMPPKGGSNEPDDVVKAAVNYMTSSSK